MCRRRRASDGATVNGVVVDLVNRRWKLVPFLGDQAPHLSMTLSDEAFCVVAGRLVVLLSTERRVLAAGEFVVVLAGTGHPFATVTDSPGTLVAVMTPGVDELVTALHQATNDHERPVAWMTSRARLA